MGGLYRSGLPWLPFIPNFVRTSLLYFRNRKRFPGFHKVMVTRVKVWGNEKSCGHGPQASVSKAALSYSKLTCVLPNFMELGKKVFYLLKYMLFVAIRYGNSIQPISSRVV